MTETGKRKDHATAPLCVCVTQRERGSSHTDTAASEINCLCEIGHIGFGSAADGTDSVVTARAAAAAAAAAAAIITAEDRRHA